jgi:nucleoside-diphosphate-sugar epimerase
MPKLSVTKFENHTFRFDSLYIQAALTTDLCFIKLYKRYMKILATGATGKVGSRFVLRLLAKGYKVQVLVRDAVKAGNLAAIDAEVVTGDLFAPATLTAAVEGVEAVIHLAALFRTFTDNEGIVKTNHAGTVALADASINASVKRFIL